MTLTLEEKIDQLHRIVKSLNRRVMRLEWVESGTELSFEEWRDKALGERKENLHELKGVPHDLVQNPD